MEILNNENFIYDGIDIVEYMKNLGYTLIITDTKGRGMINHELNFSKIVGVNGERLVDVTLPSREISINYTLVADSLSSLRVSEEILSGLLMRNKECELQFKDQKGSFKAIFSNISVSLELATIQQGTITFVCPNPFRYENEIQEHILEITANEDYQINNLSNYYTETVFTITSSGLNEFELLINDSLFKFKSEVSGTVFVIDTENLICIVDDVINLLDFSGEFPLLKAGLNTIKSNMDINLKINYRNKFV